jgi:hypothetical protein
MAQNERPNRLVMALGIATVVLFSANLLAMLSQRVWPDLHEALFASNTEAEFTAPELIMEDAIPEVVIGRAAPQILIREIAPRVVIGERLHVSTHPSSVHSVYTILHKKHSSDHGRHYRSRSNSTSHFSLDLDLDELESNIEREMERLNGDLRSAERDMERALSVQLEVEGLTGVLARKSLNLEALEEQLEEVSRGFEVRVREHAKAAEGHQYEILLQKELEMKGKDEHKARLIVREGKSNN